MSLVSYPRGPATCRPATRSLLSARRWGQSIELQKPFRVKPEPWKYHRFDNAIRTGMYLAEHTLSPLAHATP